MADTHPVGFRFRPTDEEIVDHYLRSKNKDGNNTSRVDEVISTVDIYSFDPWELASHSSSTKKATTDLVWYFYGRKDKRGERQSRKTKSGSWKKTGATTDIMRKRGNREKIGEKRVFVFQYSSKILGGSNPTKSEWVMHEYVATFLSPTQTMMTYTVCKVMFKGDSIDLPSSSAGGCEIEQNNTLIVHMNNSGGGLSSKAEGSSFELQDPRPFSALLHLEEETQIEDAIRRAINNLSTHDFNCLLNNDEEPEEDESL